MEESGLSKEYVSDMMKSLWSLKLSGIISLEEYYVLKRKIEERFPRFYPKDVEQKGTPNA